MLFLLVVLQGVGCSTTEPEDTYGYLTTHFRSPPATYRSAPLWVWNDRMSVEKIENQLEDFHSQGIGGVFIHPRPGLITEYLSDEWFSLVRHAVDVAEKKGMDVWLYDENSYPSGFAGGHVPAQMPESYNQGQGLQMFRFDRFVADELPEYVLVLKKETGFYKDITSKVADEEGQPGEYYLFSPVSYAPRGWNGGFSYVDLLVEGVTEKFIEVTMDGYEGTIGHSFGKTVPGIFTDEPNIRPPDGPGDSQKRYTIKYTPRLFEVFLDRWGYDLRPHLVALFEEVGEWKQVRHNYYSVLLELFIERWSKPWYAYTKAHDLQWTGHYWEHGWPNPQHGGDNMAMYAWHQVPAVDMLFNNEGLQPDQFGNTRAIKELSSVANQLGRRRRLSETYGGSGWELRFEDMKRLGDWEYVMGINFLNQHLSYSTIKGARKRDYPQSFSYHTPWWDHYKPLADYFARLSLALSTGQQINRTLVIEPTTTTWMYYSPWASVEHESSSTIDANAILTDIGRQFDRFVDQLESYQLDYDLGCENILRDHGSVANGRFVVGERAYDLLVLPPETENLDSATATLLDSFLDEGGHVLSFGKTPERIDGIQSKRLDSLRLQYSEQWHNAGSLDDPIVMQLLASEGFKIDQPDRAAGKLFHQRRELDKGTLVFLANFSPQDSANGRLESTGTGVDRLDLFAGSIDVYPHTIEGGRISVSFNLPPAGSLLLFIHRAGARAGSTESAADIEPVSVVRGDLEIVRKQPNTLILDYCDYEVGDWRDEGIYFYNAADSIFRLNGLEVYGSNYNPWSIAVQYKTNIVDLDLFPPESGFSATFPFEVDAGFQNLSTLQAVIEWAHLFEVRINDRILEPLANRWWLDRSFNIFDMGPYIVAGTNHLTLTARPMSIFAELEPVYILGDFDLESVDHGWRIVQPKSLVLGPWNWQGLPHYPDAVSYGKTIQVDERQRMVIKLNAWKGTVAEVQVNGQKACTVGWQPYECDISESIQIGANHVDVIVYGSLKNLLGPHHNDPVQGFVTPWSFFNAPENQPPGDMYDTLEYGLFEDFDIRLSPYR